MRILFLALLCCLVGCKKPTDVGEESLLNKVLNPATTEQVEQAKQRMHLLRSDMTHEQVFTALGLESCYTNCYGNASGGSVFRVSYQLRSGHVLQFAGVWTETGKSKLIYASLDDVSWRGDEKTPTH